jgi:hypothetical protein
MGAANPKGARAWLKSQIAANRQALQDFLASKSDLRAEFLEDAFPYHSGPLPPSLGGIASPLLLQWAETDAAGLSYLRGVMAGLVRSGEPIPAVWRDLHAGILDGTVSAPPVTGRTAVNDRRDELVMLLVSCLQIWFDLPQLANRCSRNGESAIEIVADELKELCPSLPMLTPDSIERAILRRANAKSSDPILGVIDQPT